MGTPIRPIQRAMQQAPAVRPDATAVAPSADVDMTPVAVARQQLAQNGITDFQRARGYRSRISESLYRNVAPGVYDGQGGNIAHAIAGTFMPSASVDPGNLNRPVLTRGSVESEDAWRMYLGLPQTKGSFAVSDYRPSVGSGAPTTYYKLARRWQDFIGVGDPKVPPSEQAARVRAWVQLAQNHSLDEYGDRPDDKGVLGTYKIDGGRDARGHFISYYDKWDLDYPGAANVGHPFEIYDRLYYDPKTYAPIATPPAAAVPAAPVPPLTPVG